MMIANGASASEEEASVRTFRPQQFGNALDPLWIVKDIGI
jgi:hypothetical protein